MNDPRSLQGAPDEGQTPLDPDEAAGLIPAWVATRGDLNEAEAANIRSASIWIRRQLKNDAPVASDGFLRGLHKAMFGKVWRWAGLYRNSERNIGVAPHQINMQLRQLFDDVAAWQEFGAYPSDEQAVRLHHRLTWIHPFPNGNGRTARVLVDCFLQQRGAEPFAWGRGIPANEARGSYLAAIRLADAGDYTALMNFVRV
ncbi:MAG: mobile mystery protein B [Pseudoxanthomonas sp.]